MVFILLCFVNINLFYLSSETVNMEQGGKEEFDVVMAAAQTIILEMNAMLKEFILKLPIGSQFSVADIVSRAPRWLSYITNLSRRKFQYDYVYRYNCEHCGNNFGNFSKYSDHIVKVCTYIPYLLNIPKSGTNLKVRETFWEVLNNLPLQLLLPCSQTRLMI